MGTPKGPYIYIHEGVPIIPVNWVPKLPVELGRGPHSTGSLGTPGPQFRGSPKYLDTGPDLGTADVMLPQL